MDFHGSVDTFTRTEAQAVIGSLLDKCKEKGFADPKETSCVLASVLRAAGFPQATALKREIWTAGKEVGHQQRFTISSIKERSPVFAVEVGALVIEPSVGLSTWSNLLERAHDAWRPPDSDAWWSTQWKGLRSVEVALNEKGGRLPRVSPQAFRKLSAVLRKTPEQERLAPILSSLLAVSANTAHQGTAVAALWGAVTHLNVRQGIPMRLDYIERQAPRSEVSWRKSYAYEAFVENDPRFHLSIENLCVGGVESLHTMRPGSGAPYPAVPCEASTVRWFQRFHREDLQEPFERLVEALLAEYHHQIPSGPIGDKTMRPRL